MGRRGERGNSEPVSLSLLGGMELGEEGVVTETEGLSAEAVPHREGPAHQSLPHRHWPFICRWPPASTPGH